jgi:cell division protein FtsQ
MSPTDTETRPRPVAMDPRIRERRIEVQREMGRRRLRWLAVVATIVCLAGALYLIANSALLDVDHIPVRGAQHVSVREVQAASGVHKGEALVFVDTDAVARRIERLPWVEHAAVTKLMPNSLRIIVTEYDPVAYVRAGRDVVLLAANGRALARVKAVPAGAVEIRGVRVAPANGELLSPPEAAHLTAQLPAALAQQVKAVDVGGVGVSLVLARGGEVRFGAPTDLDAKAAAALAVLAHNGAAPFAFIDVSTPATPVLHH